MTSGVASSSEDLNGRENEIPESDNWSEVLSSTSDSAETLEGHNPQGRGLDDFGCGHLQETNSLLDIWRDLRHSMLKNPEIALVCDKWAYPEGKCRTALVLVINNYVNCKQLDVFIPGEIAISAFSINDGLHPFDYWTLVDPSGEIPWGHNIEAHDEAEYYGLQVPGFSRHYKDYKRIVEEIEKMLDTCGGEAVRSDQHHIMFCLQNKIKQYTLGLEWLYKQAGRQFQHKLLPLQSLIVCLSLGGLQCLAGRKNFGMDFLEAIDVYFQAIQDAMKNIDTDSKSALTPEQEQGIRGSVEVFMTSVQRTFDSYSSIGNSAANRMATKRLNFPEAVLGAFLFEDQVSRYLAHMDYLHITSLACQYHQDKTDNLPADLVAKVKNICRNRKPGMKLTECALINAKRMIFLALDVILINYDASVREGFHYPKEEEHRPADSFQLDERK